MEEVEAYLSDLPPSTYMGMICELCVLYSIKGECNSDLCVIYRIYTSIHGYVVQIVCHLPDLVAERKHTNWICALFAPNYQANMGIICAVRALFSQAAHRKTAYNATTNLRNTLGFVVCCAVKRRVVRRGAANRTWPRP